MTMDFRQAKVVILDADGNPFPSTLDVNVASAQTLDVNVLTSAAPTPSRNPLQWQQWPNTPVSVPDNVWTDVYIYTGACFIHEVIWQLNTESMLLRFVVDSVVIANLDLDELQDDYELRACGDDSATRPYSFFRYSNKRWLFRPPVSIEAKVDFKIQMQANKGTKKAERGITTVEPR